MEQPPKNQESPEEKLKNFQEEIHGIVEEERKSGETAHFTELNPEELLPEDMVIWDKVKDESITEEDYNLYKKGMLKEGSQEMKENVSQSRKEYMRFVAVRASSVFIERYLRENADKKHQ